MPLITLVLAALLAPQASAGPAPAAPAKVVPMTVRVETDAKSAGTGEWAKELGAALAARKGEFRLVRPTEKADLVVRIESLGKAQDGTPVMNGVLVRGEAKRSFAYGYRDVKVQAEALARNLRKIADQMMTAGK
jgi:hypothetical protein